VSGHEIWHVVVLAAAVLGAGAAILLALSPLIFESPPPGLTRARRAVGVAIGGAILLVLAEWLVVH
jgi:hypothetical protein